VKPLRGMVTSWILTQGALEDSRPWAELFNAFGVVQTLLPGSGNETGDRPRIVKPLRGMVTCCILTQGALEDSRPWAELFNAFGVVRDIAPRVGGDINLC
jgi:hypothetical protein